MKYKYILLTLFLLFAYPAFGATWNVGLDNEQTDVDWTVEVSKSNLLDAFCNSNNKILKRISDKWVCADQFSQGDINISALNISTTGMDYTNLAMTNQSNNFTKGQLFISPVNISTPIDSSLYLAFNMFDSSSDGGYFSIKDSTSRANAFLPEFRGESYGFEGAGFAIIGIIANDMDEQKYANQAAIAFDSRKAVSGLTGTYLKKSNLFIFRHFGKPKMIMDVNGSVNIGSNSTATGQLSIEVTNKGLVGLVVRGNITSSFDLFQLQNSAMTPVFSVDRDGNTDVNGTIITTKNITANTFIGNVNCQDIIGNGSDYNFCLDTSTAGSGGMDYTNLCLLNETNEFEVNNSFNGNVTFNKEVSGTMIMLQCGETNIISGDDWMTSPSPMDADSGFMMPGPGSIKAVTIQAEVDLASSGQMDFCSTANGEQKLCATILASGGTGEKYVYSYADRDEYSFSSGAYIGCYVNETGSMQTDDHFMTIAIYLDYIGA